MVITETHLDAELGTPAGSAFGKAHSNIRRTAAGWSEMYRPVWHTYNHINKLAKDFFFFLYNLEPN